MHTLSRRGSLLGVAAVALVVAACSSQAGGGSSPAPSGGASQPPASAAASASAYTVQVHQDATLGAFITGEDGKTLYLLTKDGMNTSSCSGNCAKAWPPFVLEDGETVVAGSGVTGTLSTFKRDDGSQQVTINGIPLYYFAGDSAAGDTNGQGSNGVWFVVSPSGTAVGAAGSPAASPAGSSGGGKYGY